MCLIVRGRVSNLLKLPLQDAQCGNPDGWGVHIGKSVYYSFDELEPFPCIMRFLAKHKPQRTATIHFRYATHGEVDRNNCHPFNIGNNQWLMHNGVLHGDIFDHKTKSDTAILAEMLRDSGPRTRQLLLEHFSNGNRFCLLSDKEWVKFGHWHFDKPTKTWHSNRSIIGGTRFCNIPSKKPVNSKWEPASNYGYGDLRSPLEWDEIDWK